MKRQNFKLLYYSCLIIYADWWVYMFGQVVLWVVVAKNYLKKKRWYHWIKTICGPYSETVLVNVGIWSNCQTLIIEDHIFLYWALFFYSRWSCTFLLRAWLLSPFSFCSISNVCFLSGLLQLETYFITSVYVNPSLRCLQRGDCFYFHA